MDIIIMIALSIIAIDLAARIAAYTKTRKSKYKHQHFVFVSDYLKGGKK